MSWFTIATPSGTMKFKPKSQLRTIEVTRQVPVLNLGPLYITWWSLEALGRQPVVRKPASPVDRSNNFGILRLLFAVTVLLSHTPQIIDGGRNNEFLFRVFGKLTFAELAVDAFFIISGYLITQSFETSSSLWSYARKRLLRIVPGYFVNFWFCVLVVAPIAGAGLSVLSSGTFIHGIANNLRLMAPDGIKVFPGLTFATLNGSLWTIAYEFRCYILVAVLGLLGFYRPGWRVAVLAIAILCLAANGAGIVPDLHFDGDSIIGSPRDDVRLFGIFAAGASFYLFRDRLTYRHVGAGIAAVALLLCLLSKYTAEAGFGVFGAYLIFWLAFAVPTILPKVFTQDFDISYGVYLYAWPIQSLIVYYISRDAALVSSLALIATIPLALLSWYLIERPALRLARPRAATRAYRQPAQ